MYGSGQPYVPAVRILACCLVAAHGVAACGVGAQCAYCSTWCVAARGVAARGVLIAARGVLQHVVLQRILACPLVAAHGVGAQCAEPRQLGIWSYMEGATRRCVGLHEYKEAKCITIWLACVQTCIKKGLLVSVLTYLCVLTCAYFLCTCLHACRSRATSVTLETRDGRCRSVRSVWRRRWAKWTLWYVR